MGVVLQVETERYYLPHNDPITPALKERMCENLEALLAMSEEARAEFLARGREAMGEAKKRKSK